MGGAGSQSPRDMSLKSCRGAPVTPPSSQEDGFCSQTLHDGKRNEVFRETLEKLDSNSRRQFLAWSSTWPPHSALSSTLLQ